ncbi:hypothetical protein MRX96_043768 [Rhipicephalus microplus]
MTAAPFPLSYIKRAYTERGHHGGIKQMKARQARETVRRGRGEEVVSRGRHSRGDERSSQPRPTPGGCSRYSCPLFLSRSSLPFPSPINFTPRSRPIL